MTITRSEFERNEEYEKVKAELTVAEEELRQALVSRDIEASRMASDKVVALQRENEKLIREKDPVRYDTINSLLIAAAAVVTAGAVGAALGAGGAGGTAAAGGTGASGATSAVGTTLVRAGSVGAKLGARAQGAVIGALASVLGISALGGIINKLSGKAFNRFFSELGLDVGDLKITQEWKAYIQPVFENGRWIFPIDSEEKLRNRMLDAGLSQDEIDAQISLLNPIRRANENVVISQGAAIGQEAAPPADIRPGETEFQASERAVKEQREEQEKIDTGIQERQQQGPSFQRTGSPEQQTAQAIADPVQQEIRRRQVASQPEPVEPLPPVIEEAPVGVQQIRQPSEKELAAQAGNVEERRVAAEERQRRIDESKKKRTTILYRSTRNRTRSEA